jgi:hypothetical protein
MRVHVTCWYSGYPGVSIPDVDEWLEKDEALERYGEPDVQAGNEWQYF